MKLEYSSNNSGGRWWLTDDNWLALEAAGWNVEWAKDMDASSPIRAIAVRDGRYMGALARAASLECERPADGIRSFEKATGLDSSDEGCNCCGPPHSFSWSVNGNHGYVSGAEIAGLIADRPDLNKLSHRELLDLAAKAGR